MQADIELFLKALALITSNPVVGREVASSDEDAL